MQLAGTRADCDQNLHFATVCRFWSLGGIMKRRPKRAQPLAGTTQRKCHKKRHYDELKRAAAALTEPAAAPPPSAPPVAQYALHRLADPLLVLLVGFLDARSAGRFGACSQATRRCLFGLGSDERVWRPQAIRAGFWLPGPDRGVPTPSVWYVPAHPKAVVSSAFTWRRAVGVLCSARLARFEFRPRTVRDLARCVQIVEQAQLLCAKSPLDTRSWQLRASCVHCEAHALVFAWQRTANGWVASRQLTLPVPVGTRRRPWPQRNKRPKPQPDRILEVVLMLPDGPSWSHHGRNQLRADVRCATSAPEINVRAALHVCYVMPHDGSLRLEKMTFDAHLQGDICAEWVGTEYWMRRSGHHDTFVDQGLITLDMDRNVVLSAKPVLALVFVQVFECA